MATSAETIRGATASLAFLALAALLLLLTACNPGRGRASDDDDDDAGDDDAGDDDSAAGDDDTGDDDTGDDDAGDDDAGDDDAGDDDAGDDDGGDPSGPVIGEIRLCETTIVSAAYAFIEVDVTDADGDLDAPITYFLMIDSGAAQIFSFDADLGADGLLSHLERIDNTTLPRGTTHDFSFRILDEQGNASEWVTQGWAVPVDEFGDPC